MPQLSPLLNRLGEVESVERYLDLAHLVVPGELVVVHHVQHDGLVGNAGHRKLEPEGVPEHGVLAVHLGLGLELLVVAWQEIDLDIGVIALLQVPALLDGEGEGAGLSGGAALHHDGVPQLGRSPACTGGPA